MINATLCFLKNNGTILLIYRNRGESDIHNGWYVPPGGKTQRGERGIDCIIREFKEETGLNLINPRLRVIATFYNEGRILGGKENPEDWCVEVYEANKFEGELKGEHPNSKPYWIKNSELDEIKMYEGDRRILSLIDKEGIFEVITRYQREELVHFEYKRVD